MTAGTALLGEQQSGNAASPSPVGEKGSSRWIFRVLPPQVRRVWQLVTSYPDYLLQLSLLLRDPIYRGSNVRQGTDQPILLIPGFLVGDWTLGVMARWLRRLGYRPYLSGIDWNVRTPERTGELLARRLIYIVRETGSPVIMVGHSLGGMLARSLGSYFPAVIFPEVVRHVVALGSPIYNSPHATHPFIRLAFLALQSLERAPSDLFSFSERVSAPLPAGVGFTAIFSPRDEIVDWRACVDPQGDNYQVSGRHLGLVVNPYVYQILAHILGSLPADS
jgi:pimeloyl-ACP methyl ester carboxylesterase